MNRLDLRQRLRRKPPWLQQEQFRIPQQRSQRIIHVVLHVVHVAAQRRLVGVLRRAPLRLPRQLQRLGAPQRFARQQQHHLRPILAQRHVQQLWIFLPQQPQFFRFRRRAQNQRGIRFHRTQHVRKFSVFQWANHDQVRRGGIRVLPEFARHDANSRELTFHLPAGRQQAGEFRVVRKNQYVCISQKPCSLTRFPAYHASQYFELKLFGFVQRRKQPLLADSQIHRRFRVLRWLRRFHALLQPRNFHARNRQRPVEPRRISRFLRALQVRSKQRPRHHRAPQILRGWPVLAHKRSHFPRRHQQTHHAQLHSSHRTPARWRRRNQLLPDLLHARLKVEGGPGGFRLFRCDSFGFLFRPV